MKLVLHLATCSLALTLTTGALVAQRPSSLRDAALGELRVTRHPTTGAVTFVTGRIVAGVTSEQLTAAPELEALAFLDEHAAALGMPGAADRLVPLDRTVVDELGMTHVRFQQYVDEVPVHGIQVLVHYDATGTVVTAINGDFVPGLSLSTVPALGERRALAIAHSIEPQGTLSGIPELVVYTRYVDPALAGDHLAWLVQLEDMSVPSRRLYVIDALTGAVLRTLEQLQTVLDRRIFDAMGTGTGTLVRSEGDGATGDADVDNLYDFLGDTYDYYFNLHGRDSYDGSGATISGVANWDGPESNDCPNAFWNGVATWFCAGAATDDIVAHELTHAVTQFTAGLIYQGESGALNESYSDIFGELVDIDTIHGDGSASPWLMGEGSSLGVIRSLANPPAHGDPDRGSNFRCTQFDNGGVHSNSGIPNKAAYLMAEGGTFNGYTVSALGNSMTSGVQYRALTMYLTPVSNFLANYNALQQACADLHGGTSASCVEVGKALLAVEMDAVAACPVQCPLQLAVGGGGDADPGRGAGLLRTMYGLRTQVLRGTPYGRRLIDLYYAHAVAVTRIVGEDERLRAQLVALVDRFAAGLETLGTNEADTVHLSPHTAALFAAVLRSLEQAEPGSPLALAVRGERERLSPVGLVGSTFSSAWERINLRAGFD